MAEKKTKHAMACRIAVGLLLAQTAATAQKRFDRTEFCELLRHPELFDGKEVTVRATWVSGFEWSYMTCLTCLTFKDVGKVWLDFSDDLDDASRKACTRYGGRNKS